MVRVQHFVAAKSRAKEQRLALPCLLVDGVRERNEPVGLLVHVPRDQLPSHRVRERCQSFPEAVEQAFVLRDKLPARLALPSWSLTSFSIGRNECVAATARTRSVDINDDIV